MTARQERNIRRAAERELRKREERAAKLSRETENIPAAATPSVPPTPTRAEINRANAQHSTGPKTVEGKENSKHNSFKHGLYSKQLVLPSEDPAELDELRATLRAEHLPANETEEILVNEIAEHFWRLRRMRKFEARGLQPENFDSWLEGGLLNLVARTMASAERGMYKAISTLRQIRKDNAAAKQSPHPENDGFVPSNSAAAPEESKFVRQNVLEIGFVPAFLEEEPSSPLTNDPDPELRAPRHHQTAA